jgi:hypothetical protein
MSDTRTGFYVTLLSDASRALYPQNSCARFTTRLRTPLDLRGDWEVALVDLSYPHNWYNVPKSLLVFTYLIEKEKPMVDVERYALTELVLLEESAPKNLANTNEMNVRFDWSEEPLSEEQKILIMGEVGDLAVDMRKVWVAPDMLSIYDTLELRTFLPYTLPEGYIEGPEELMKYLPYAVRQLQSRLSRAREQLQLDCGYDAVLDRVYLRSTTGTKGRVAWIISDRRELFDMMGLAPVAHNREAGTFYIYRIPSLGRQPPRIPKLDRLRLETELIEQQSVGEREERTLAYIPVRGSHGQQSYWAPPQALYLPLAKNTIDSIEIRLLCSDTDEPVPFVARAGKTCVRLHFRRRRGL